MRFYTRQHRHYCGIDLHAQCNLPEPTRKIIYKANRAGIAEKFTDPSVRRSVEVDFELVAHYDQLIRSLELFLVRTAKQHDPQAFQRLRSLPGVGKILALTLPGPQARPGHIRMSPCLLLGALPLPRARS